MSTFKKMSFKALGGVSSVATFVASVKEAKAITINKVIDLGDTKEKANITHIKGSNFLDVNIGDKNYPRIGFDLFCKSILASNIETSVDVSAEAEADVELAFEGKLGQAYVRQQQKLAKAKVEKK
jgi:hypothetical protein